MLTAESLEDTRSTSSEHLQGSQFGLAVAARYYVPWYVRSGCFSEEDPEFSLSFLPSASLPREKGQIQGPPFWGIAPKGPTLSSVRPSLAGGSLLGVLTYHGL